MAARRSPSVCLFCQVRQSAVGRRRPSIRLSRQLSSLAQPPDDNTLLPAQIERAENGDTDDGPTLGVGETLRQWKLYSRIDELREAALGFDALWKRKDLRLEVLRNLSNPWPEAPSGRQVHISRPYVLPESGAAPVSHEIFRRNVRAAIGTKAIRQVLRKQLLRCEWPREILRVVAVALQSRVVAGNLPTLHEPIMRAMYRCRQNVSDPLVLKTLNQIITRFHYAGLTVEPRFHFMALKFAARSRSLSAMRKYLKAVRDGQFDLSSNLFRSVIAKFSIGHRGLGEIRNGRWKRQDLLQVLKGFDDAHDLPEDEKYHLEVFMDRDDWQYLHGWVAVLARCKDGEGVLREWEYWKESAARKDPKQLDLGEGRGRPMTSKLRGDYWFVEQMACTGDMAKAWRLLEETGIKFSTLKFRVKDMYLDGLEHATALDEEVREAMIEKYDRDLSKIERALGVAWIVGLTDGDGHHELVEDQEEVLDRLGEEGWRLEEGHGYPDGDDLPIVSDSERPLHHAAESTPATRTD